MRDIVVSLFYVDSTLLILVEHAAQHQRKELDVLAENLSPVISTMP